MFSNKSIKADNAILLAAGYARRFAPLSDRCPKGLLPVRGEVLIERQIRQLLAAGIPQIIVVTGYKSPMFAYLADRYDVILVENPQYCERNNHSSIYAAREYLANSYICSCDNYFTENIFTPVVEYPYYAALYSPGRTGEYCLDTDAARRITHVSIGGRDSWYMLGHVFWDARFSQDFLRILKKVYDLPGTKDLLWEQIYMQHLDQLCLYLKTYPPGIILEFDSLDELARFDPAYRTDPLSLLP